MENAKETYVLKMDHIVKEYFGNCVLKRVDLAVRPGEIHALMGENGAGKSTLMNILFGMPVIHNTGGFEGTVEIDGKEVQINSPVKAMELGIGMVHQEFMLIPGFPLRKILRWAGKSVMQTWPAAYLENRWKPWILIPWIGMQERPLKPLGLRSKSM